MPSSPARILVWRLDASPGTGAPRWTGGALVAAEKERNTPGAAAYGWTDERGPEDARDGDLVGYWMPTCIDAHTHLGDAFLRPERESLPRDLEKLVAPPNGIKHQRLQETDPSTIAAAMRERAEGMHARGTDLHLDFREGGRAGIQLLAEAVGDTALTSIAFGRPASAPTSAPSGDDTWDRELERLLHDPKGGLVAHGIGLSALADLPAPRVHHAGDVSRRFRRPLALHLSERVREPVEAALELDPALVVHLCRATDGDLAALADARGLMAVLCPTSNAFFGLPCPAERAWESATERGLMVGLGTDNAMLSDGDLADEARAVCGLAPDADLAWLLAAMTVNPRRLLAQHGFEIQGGRTVVTKARDGVHHASGGLVWALQLRSNSAWLREAPEDVALRDARRLFHLAPEGPATRFRLPTKP